MDRISESVSSVLANVLQSVQVARVRYDEHDLARPLELEAGDHATFHFVSSGSALLKIDGIEQPIALTSGDLCVLPHGHGHALTGSPESHAVSGVLELSDPRGNPLLAALPAFIRIEGEAGRSARWLEPTLQIMAYESASERPGAQAVITRLAGVLFIQVVRRHLSQSALAEPGWLRALSEPQIASALALIHESPESAWTVETLAGKVGMSRSTFAGRFVELVGEPPLHYITRWRMQKAKALLRDGNATLGEVADRSGYESEAAFSKAFKRWVGASPGAYRRSARSDGLSRARVEASVIHA